MKNLFPNTRTYRGGRYSGSKKHIRTEVPCDGCSHCDSKCCTEADCVCVDCPPAGITKRGQLKIIDNRNSDVKFMNNLFKNTRTYRGDRYSNSGGRRKFCRSVGLDPNKGCTRTLRQGGWDKGQPENIAMEILCNNDFLSGLRCTPYVYGGGGDGTGGGGGGNDGDDNGDREKPDTNGEGMDTTTIMIWTGVAILLIALIIGGAYAIKKIRT